MRQAIVAWWNGITSTFGRSFVAVADAAAGRNALELGTGDTVVFGKIRSGFTGGINVTPADGPAEAQFASTTAAVLSVARYSNSNNAPVVFCLKSRSDTLGTNSAVAALEQTGNFRFAGADGAGNFRTGAVIGARAVSAFSSTNAESEITFSTAAAGSLTFPIRLIIASNGDLLPQAQTTLGASANRFSESHVVKPVAYGPSILASYTLATLPAAAANARGLVYVSNLTGQAAPCYSDGTNWRRVSDNSIAN
ncbi:MAG: hypothetical protein ACK4TD_00590 [Ectopseudomonas guguanensis]|uniref:hypothetical protein n=1 Tax=Ectopseudomonas guguanensis TaxID=1198456 RepID=UPI00391C7B55